MRNELRKAGGDVLLGKHEFVENLLDNCNGRNGQYFHLEGQSKPYTAEVINSI